VEAFDEFDSNLNFIMIDLQEMTKKSA